MWKTKFSIVESYCPNIIFGKVLYDLKNIKYIEISYYTLGYNMNRGNRVLYVLFAFFFLGKDNLEIYCHLYH